MRGIILAGGSGHPPLSDHPGRQQAAVTGVRQTDDLLPAVHVDDGRHSRRPGDHHRRDAPAFQRVLGDGAGFGININYACKSVPKAWPRPSSSVPTTSATVRSP